MYLTKLQSKVVGLSVIVLFFGLGIFLVQNKQLPSIVKTSLKSPLSTQEQSQEESKASLTLGAFHRSEIKDGKKKWEVKGSTGKYYPESATVKVETAILWVYEEDGKVVELRANTATLFLDGVSLRKVDGFGAVSVVYNGDLVIETNEATYDKEKNTVKAPGPVTVKSKTLDIKGVGLNGNLLTKEFSLDKDVTTEVAPRAVGK